MSRILWPKIKVLHQADTPLTEVKRILNDLYLISSSPLSEDVKTSICKNILVKEETLKIKDVELPKRLLRLKIMSEFLKERNKEQILMRITSLKLGVLGYFMQRQESVMRFSVNKKGKFQQVKETLNVGEWHGLVDGISVIIRMTGTTCDSIRINKFLDPMSLGHSLLNLIREFKLGPPEVSKSNEAKIYLDDKANFSVFRGTVRSLIPIILDKELEDPISDKLFQGNWELKVQNLTLRLKVAIRDHIGLQKEVTILNYTLRSTDWQPNTKFSTDIYDLPNSMKKWFRGEPADLAQLMIDIGVGNSWIKMSQLLARLKTERKDVIVNLININSLALMIKKNIVKRVSDLRKSQKIKLQSMMKHYKEDEKDIFVKNFKASEEMMVAFTSMSQNKTWTETTATKIWGEGGTQLYQDDPIHKELLRLQEARGSRPWDVESDDEGSVATVGSDFLRDRRAMDEHYLSNQITAKLDDDILENIRELFMEQEETFQMIDERELITADVVPPAIVFLQSVRSHLALEQDHVNISKNLNLGDLDGLRKCKFTGLASGLMSLACDKNFLAQANRRTTEDAGVSSPEDSSEEEPSSKPELSVSTARGREVYMSKDELLKEQEYLTTMLTAAPKTMQYDLEIILRRIASELNYRSTEFKVTQLPNIRAKDFLKIITNKLLKDDDDSPIKNGRTEDERNTLTKIFIKDKCDFLDNISAISSSHIHSIMTSLDHDRLNNHLIEAGAIAIESNIQLMILEEGILKETFLTKFPFLMSKVTITCNPYKQR